jgi:hypothetical protein
MTDALPVPVLSILMVKLGIGGWADNLALLGRLEQGEQHVRLALKSITLSD